MKRCWIKIKVTGGMARVSAFDAGNGLAIHRTYWDSGNTYEDDWTVTHRPSGYAIETHLSRKEAEAVAEAIRPLCDWPSVTWTGPKNGKAIRAAIEAAREGN